MIAIPNINKPKSCCECPIAKSYLDCLMEKKYVCPIGHTDDCPLIEIVQCKDCKHRDPEDKKCDCGMFERQGCIFPVADDYFCKYGERRKDVNNT